MALMFSYDVGDLKRFFVYALDLQKILEFVIMENG